MLVLGGWVRILKHLRSGVVAAVVVAAGAVVVVVVVWQKGRIGEGL